VPRVQFYHNTEDPLALACELAARACAGGRQVALRLADEGAAQRVDQLLWSFDQLAFVPHVTVNHPLAAETPVVIGLAGGAMPWPARDLLFNLATDIPPDFADFHTVVEIIGRDEASRLPARARWMHYKQAGHPLKAFDSERREAIA
jgi:DNA polymerase-3 subunit chi